jgi:hypothetical protein
MFISGSTLHKQDCFARTSVIVLKPFPLAGSRPKKAGTIFSFSVNDSSGRDVLYLGAKFKKFKQLFSRKSNLKAARNTQDFFPLQLYYHYQGWRHDLESGRDKIISRAKKIFDFVPPYPQLTQKWGDISPQLLWWRRP